MSAILAGRRLGIRLDDVHDSCVLHPVPLSPHSLLDRNIMKSNQDPDGHRTSVSADTLSTGIVKIIKNNSYKALFFNQS